MKHFRALIPPLPFLLKNEIFLYYNIGLIIYIYNFVANLTKMFQNVWTNFGASCAEIELAIKNV